MHKKCDVVETQLGHHVCYCAGENMGHSLNSLIVCNDFYLFVPERINN